MSADRPGVCDDPSRTEETSMRSDPPQLRPVDPAREPGQPVSDEDLLLEVARGDQQAFAALYDRLAGTVFGVVRAVLRDPSQSEEVTQEVLVEVWRTAPRFDPGRGGARTWILTMAHRRAIDRVRSEQASRDRTERVGHRDTARAFDDVADQVELRFEHEQVREGLAALTDLQREAVELAYYQGYTYREVSELLGAPLGTIKTRMRDGLIRLRDAMGVTT
jgi:RNA polymerase sigma-70 factor, ECF subfamily